MLEAGSGGWEGGGCGRWRSVGRAEGEASRVVSMKALAGRGGRLRFAGPVADEGGGIDKEKRRCAPFMVEMMNAWP